METQIGKQQKILWRVKAKGTLHEGRGCVAQALSKGAQKWQLWLKSPDSLVQLGVFTV
jgi:hypothetical protein